MKAFELYKDWKWSVETQLISYQLFHCHLKRRIRINETGTK